MEIFESLKGISIGSLSLAALLSAIVVFIICYIVIKIFMRLVRKAMARSKMDGALKGFVCTSANALAWVLAVIIVADELGIPTASLLAVLSIAGLALSLSIQNILSNLFSGITLLVTRPFKAGDFVDIGANSGTIKTIGLFYTVLDTLDNKTVSVPNSDVTAASVVNYSSEPLRRVDMAFSAAYESSTQSVKDAILAAAAEDGRIMDEPVPFVAIKAYKDSTVEYVVRLWCKNEDYWDVYFGMNERVRASFEKNGVIMSYPHVNVHMVE